VTRYGLQGWLIIAGVALLAACAEQPIPPVSSPPGFFSGLLHGAIAPFALVGSIFFDFRIYAFPNSGWFYDLGFLLGLGAVWGGGSHGVMRRR
jgi:hypothetical protein